MNKDTLFKHVVAMGDKSTHGEYKSQAMTDMHREAFERSLATDGLSYAEASALWCGDGYADGFLQTAWEGWCAALRYRDEQEKRA